MIQTPLHTCFVPYTSSFSAYGLILTNELYRQDVVLLMVDARINAETIEASHLNDRRHSECVWSSIPM